MGSSAWWLPWAMYMPMGAVGLAWALLGRGEVVHPAGRPWLSEQSSIALMAGLVLAGIVTLATVFATRVLVERARWARELYDLLRAPLLGLSRARLITLAVLSAAGEELFFRGALQPTVGLVAASVAFGLVHVSPRGTGVAWTLWACVMGFVFGALFEASGHLIVPMLAHALINYANMQYMCGGDPTLLDTPRRRPHTLLNESAARRTRDA